MNNHIPRIAQTVPITSRIDQILNVNLTPIFKETKHIMICGSSIHPDEPVMVKDPYGNVHIMSIKDFPSDHDGKWMSLSHNNDLFEFEWSAISDFVKHHYEGNMYTIRVETNRSTRITEDHSVLVWNGLKVLEKKGEDLQVGDVLLVPRKIPSCSLNNLEVDGFKVIEALMVILGYYTAEGSLSGNPHKERFRIINNKSYRRRDFGITFDFGPDDRPYIEKLSKAVESYGRKLRVTPRKDSRGIRCSFTDKFLWGFLEKHVGRGAHHKHVPSFVYNVSDELQRVFLTCWLEGDAGTTVSKQLASDMLYLLPFLGDSGRLKTIPPKITTIKNHTVHSTGGYQIIHETSFTSFAPPLFNSAKAIMELLRFGNYTGVAGYVDQKLRALTPRIFNYLLSGRRLKRLNILRLLEIEPNLTNIEILQRSKEQTLDNLNYVLGQLTTEGWLIRTARVGYVLSAQAKQWLQYIDRIINAMKENVSFCRITEISTEHYCGDVYDFKVPGNENFVAGFGGIVCHNSGSGKTSLLLLMLDLLLNNGETIVWRDDSSMEVLSVAEYYPIRIFVPGGCSINFKHPNVEYVTYNPLEPGLDSLFNQLKKGCVNSIEFDLFAFDMRLFVKFWSEFFYNIYKWKRTHMHIPIALLTDEINDLCFQDTMVVNTMPKMLSEYAVGDTVLSLEGKIEEVEEVLKRRYAGPAIRIKPRYTNMSVLSTFTHPYFVINRSDVFKYGASNNPHPIVDENSDVTHLFREVPANELNPKQHLLIIPRCTVEKDVDKISLKPYLWSKKKYSLAVVERATNLKNEGLNEFEISRQLHIPRSTIEYWLRYSPKEISPKTRRKVPDALSVDSTLMGLIGYYIAEGHPAWNGPHFGFHKKEVETWIRDLDERIKKITLHHVHVDRHNRDDGVDAVVYSKPLAKFFAQFGKTSSEKRLPLWCMLLPLEKQAEMLKCYWRGDGSGKENDEDGYRMSTSSRTLAYQLSFILNRFGIPNKFYLDQKKQYNIGISLVGAEKFAKIVGHKFEKRISRRCCIITKKTILLAFKTSQEYYAGTVYNLRVKNHPSFTITNAAVHNCPAVKKGCVPQQTQLSSNIFFCLPPDQLIYGDSFVKPIKDVSEGEYVLTKSGVFKRVTGISIHDFNGELVEIRSFYNLPLKLTPNHTVPVKRYVPYGEKTWLPYWANVPQPSQNLKHEIVEVPASEIKSGDWVWLPKIRQKGLGQLRKLDVAKTIRNLNLKYKETEDAFFFRKNVKTPKFIPLIYDFGSLLGYYISEGSVGNKDCSVIFTFNSDEKQYAEETENLMETLFSLKPTSSVTGEHTIQLTFTSKIIAGVFKELCGSGAFNKHIPRSWKSFPKETLKGLITCVFRGDGCEQCNDVVSYSTVSPELVHQLRLLLLQKRCLTGIKDGDIPKFGRHRTFTLTIPKGFNKAFEDKFGFGFALACQRGPYQDVGNQGNLGEGFWLRVREVKRVSYQGPVYNISVEDDPYFIANGYTVHNSFKKFRKEKIRLVASTQGYGDVHKPVRTSFDFYLCKHLDSANVPECVWQYGKVFEKLGIDDMIVIDEKRGFNRIKVREFVKPKKFTIDWSGELTMPLPQKTLDAVEVVNTKLALVAAILKEKGASFQSLADLLGYQGPTGVSSLIKRHVTAKDKAKISDFIKVLETKETQQTEAF